MTFSVVAFKQICTHENLSLQQLTVVGAYGQSTARARTRAAPEVRTGGATATTQRLPTAGPTALAPCTSPGHVTLLRAPVGCLITLKLNSIKLGIVLT